MELVKRMEMRETGWIKMSKSVLRFLGREHSLKEIQKPKAFLASWPGKDI
jgi:hypothetical protein